MFLRENIKCLRKFKSLSQEQLAMQLKVKRSNLAAYEEGRAEPGLEFLNKFSSFFGVTIDDLVKRELFIEAQIKTKDASL